MTPSTKRSRRHSPGSPSRPTLAESVAAARGDSGPVDRTCVMISESPRTVSASMDTPMVRPDLTRPFPVGPPRLAAASARPASVVPRYSAARHRDARNARRAGHGAASGRAEGGRSRSWRRAGRSITGGPTLAFVLGRVSAVTAPVWAPSESGRLTRGLGAHRACSAGRAWSRRVRVAAVSPFGDQERCRGGGGTAAGCSRCFDPAAGFMGVVPEW